MYAANGTRLGSIQSDVLRTPITTAQMPRLLRQATVAIEDQRFYKNNGVDVTGIFRSAVKDVLHGETLQGASTITMQLMRNLYLGSDTHTFKQKVDEAKLAIEYNKHHSKQSILTDYLNSVTYGTVEGRTALGVRPPRGSSSTRVPTSSTCSSRRCWPACRRRPRSTTRSSTRKRRASGATRCWARWPNCTTSPAPRRHAPKRRRLK